MIVLELFIVVHRTTSIYRQLQLLTIAVKFKEFNLKLKIQDIMKF